jgi:hypothetical protein
MHDHAARFVAAVGRNGIGRLDEFEAGASAERRAPSAGEISLSSLFVKMSIAVVGTPARAVRMTLQSPLIAGPASCGAEAKASPSLSLT